MTVLFISDLHLHAGDAETTRRFIEFIDGPARAARELYILGDLFEAWIGDDDDDPRLAPIVAALHGLTDSGRSVRADARQSRLLAGSAVLRADGLSPARRLRARHAVRPARVADARRPALHRRHPLHDVARRAALAELAARLPCKNARRAPPDRQRLAAALRDRDRRRRATTSWTSIRRPSKARCASTTSRCYCTATRIGPPCTASISTAGRPRASSSARGTNRRASCVGRPTGFALETFS